MKILNVDLRGNWGGTQAMTLNHARYLEQQGDIELVNVISEGSVLDERMQEEGFAYTHVPNCKGPEKEISIAALAEVIEREKPDVIVSQGIAMSRYVAQAIERAGTGTKHIAVIHSTNTTEINHLADGFIAVSSMVRDQAIADGIPPEKIEHVPNFMTEPMPAFNPDKQMGEPLRLGYLGRATVEKNPDRFVETVSTLRQRGRDVVGVFGGEGPLLDQAKQKAQELGLKDGDISWLGFIEEDQKKAYFESIDVLVLPSDTESFSLVMLEAMRHGVPVVTTETAGPKSIMSDGENALLTDFSAEALANSVERLMDDPALYQKLRYNAYDLARDYDVDEIGPKLIKAIKKLIGLSDPDDNPRPFVTPTTHAAWQHRPSV